MDRVVFVFSCLAMIRIASATEQGVCDQTPLVNLHGHEIGHAELKIDLDVGAHKNSVPFSKENESGCVLFLKGEHTQARVLSAQKLRLKIESVSRNQKNPFAGGCPKSTRNRYGCPIVLKVADDPTVDRIECLRDQSELPATMGALKKFLMESLPSFVVAEFHALPDSCSSAATDRQADERANRTSRDDVRQSRGARAAQ